MAKKNTYYRTCPNCGAALDPGERCDCERENMDNINALLKRMDARQLRRVYDLANDVYVGNPGRAKATAKAKTRQALDVDIVMSFEDWKRCYKPRTDKGISRNFYRFQSVERFVWDDSLTDEELYVIFHAACRIHHEGMNEADRALFTR